MGKKHSSSNSSIPKAMDPLSITAAMVGLLGAVAKISSSLTYFIDNVKGASALAHEVREEISDIRTCLAQLQTIVFGTGVESRSRVALVMIDQIVVTLTTSVLNFSKLEEIVDSLNIYDSPMQGLTKLRWARKEKSIRAILNRLQVSKMSLNLMLTTLTWCACFEF